MIGCRKSTAILAGRKTRNKAAGRHAKNTSSNRRVKSKDRQLVFTRGPKDRSSDGEQSMLNSHLRSEEVNEH